MKSAATGNAKYSWPTSWLGCCREVAPAKRAPITWLDEVLRTVALEISPPGSPSDLDFSSIHTETARARPYGMLRELTRNLLHNAVRHAPQAAANWR